MKIIGLIGLFIAVNGQSNDNVATWSSAHLQCAGRGGLFVNHGESLEELRGVISTTPIWLGGRRVHTSWTWADGHPLYETRGCFKRPLNLNLQYEGITEVFDCFLSCQSVYKYGVISGDRCTCIDFIGNLSRATNDNCNQPCVRNFGETCGGWGFISVYERYAADFPFYSELSNTDFSDCGFLTEDRNQLVINADSCGHVNTFKRAFCKDLEGVIRQVDDYKTWEDSCQGSTKAHVTGADNLHLNDPKYFWIGLRRSTIWAWDDATSADFEVDNIRSDEKRGGCLAAYEDEAKKIYLTTRPCNAQLRVVCLHGVPPHMAVSTDKPNTTSKSSREPTSSTLKTTATTSPSTSPSTSPETTTTTPKITSESTTTLPTLKPSTQATSTPTMTITPSTTTPTLKTTLSLQTTTSKPQTSTTLLTTTTTTTKRPITSTSLPTTTTITTSKPPTSTRPSTTTKRPTTTSLPPTSTTLLTTTTTTKRPTTSTILPTTITTTKLPSSTRPSTTTKHPTTNSKHPTSPAPSTTTPKHPPSSRHPTTTTQMPTTIPTLNRTTSHPTTRQTTVTLKSPTTPSTTQLSTSSLDNKTTATVNKTTQKVTSLLNPVFESTSKPIGSKAGESTRSTGHLPSVSGTSSSTGTVTGQRLQDTSPGNGSGHESNGLFIGLGVTGGVVLLILLVVLVAVINRTRGGQSKIYRVLLRSRRSLSQNSNSSSTASKDNLVDKSFWGKTAKRVKLQSVTKDDRIIKWRDDNWGFEFEDGDDSVFSEPPSPVKNGQVASMGVTTRASLAGPDPLRSVHFEDELQNRRSQISSSGNGD